METVRETISKKTDRETATQSQAEKQTQDQSTLKSKAIPKQHTESSQNEKNTSSSSLLISVEYWTAIIRNLIERLFYIEINGLQYIPLKRGAILVCNHTDIMDIGIQFAFLPRKLHFLAKKELFMLKDYLQSLFFQKGSPLLAPPPQLLRDIIETSITYFSEWLNEQFIECGVHPIDRNYHEKVNAKEAFKYYHEIENEMLKLLQNGCLLSIFPEGTRTETGVMKPFHSLAAKLAVRAQVPIIPSGINGAWKFTTIESLFSGRMFQTLIRYNIGKPIMPEEFPKENNEKKAMRELTAQLEKQVYALTQQKSGDKPHKGTSLVL